MSGTDDSKNRWFMLDIPNWYGEAGYQIFPKFPLKFGPVDKNGKIPVTGTGTETLFYG